MKPNHMPDAVATIAGLAFAVLMFLSLSGVDPLKEASDAELVAWWSDSGNIRDTYLSMYFMLAAVPCLLVFVSALHGRLSATDGSPSPVATLMLAAGICFAAMLLVGDAARGSIAHAVRFGGEPLPEPDTLRLMTSLTATVFALMAVPAGAVMIAAASWLVVRTRAMPVWLAYAGGVVVIVTAALVAMNIGQFASPLLQLWIVAAGVELWRTGRIVAARQPERVASATGHAVSG